MHRGIVMVFPKNTAPVVAGLASAGVENVNVLSKVANGSIVLEDGLEHMGNMNIAMGFEFFGINMQLKGRLCCLGLLLV